MQKRIPYGNDKQRVLGCGRVKVALMCDECVRVCAGYIPPMCDEGVRGRAGYIPPMCDETARGRAGYVPPFAKGCEGWGTRASGGLWEAGVLSRASLGGGLFRLLGRWF